MDADCRFVHPTVEREETRPWLFKLFLGTLITLKLQLMSFPPRNGDIQ